MTDATARLLDAVADAHREALAAQQAMQEAARYRDSLVRAAVSAGITSTELQTTLGVNKQRISQIINKE